MMTQQEQVTKVGDGKRVWIDFVKSLQENGAVSIPVRPYHPALTESLRIFLKKRQDDAIWQEWTAQPESYVVDNQAYFVIDLTINHERGPYCFTFLLENDQWYFQHVESILLRLDKVGSLPVRNFPDLPEAEKSWMREEIRVSEMVRLFNWLSQEKGKEFAFDWFRDGEGYFLAARSWVPFVPAHRAFILYLCWEQANLRGAAVTLTELSNRAAFVQITPIYLALYQRAAHLRQQISFDDYRRLFITIWSDRAEKGGWQVTINIQDETCGMIFRR